MLPRIWPLLPSLKQHYHVHYLGSMGIEKDIMATLGIAFYPITCAKLERRLTFKNLTILFKLFKGVRESTSLLKKIKPVLVFSKGGFVAVPVVMAAHRLGIPVISHESDITMGLANKIILHFCSVMCCSFEKTTHINPKKCLYTGSPIRSDLFSGNPEIAKKNCNFTCNRPTVLVMGGSLGARAINQAVVKNLPQLLKKYNIIHLVGKGNLSHIALDGYKELEFVHDIGNYLALADCIVSRAGSNSIFEFLALKKPMLLIPLPLDASRGDQILNAQEFLKNGWCLVLPQEQVTSASLEKNINQLFDQKNRLVAAMNKSKTLNATKTILSLIEKYQKKLYKNTRITSGNN